MRQNARKGKEGKAGFYVRINYGDNPFFQSASKNFLFEASFVRDFPILPTFPAFTDLEVRATEVGTSTGIEFVTSTFIILERTDKKVPFILPGLLEPSEVWST